jgi:hypothetical protein
MVSGLAVELPCAVDAALTRLPQPPPPVLMANVTGVSTLVRPIATATEVCVAGAASLAPLPSWRATEPSKFTRIVASEEWWEVPPIKE